MLWRRRFAPLLFSSRALGGPPGDGLRLIGLVQICQPAASAQGARGEGREREICNVDMHLTDICDEDDKEKNGEVLFANHSSLELSLLQKLSRIRGSR
jgi:hypothetical protein